MLECEGKVVTAEELAQVNVVPSAARLASRGVVGREYPYGVR
jgi:hypothetical protein